MNSSESFAWYDRDSSCWKTSQLSLLTSTQVSYLQSWPRQGVLPQAGDPGPVMLQNMLGMQAEPELLPTPSASIPNDGETPQTWLARRELVKARLNNGNGMGMPLAVKIKVELLPTPLSSAAKEVGPPGSASSRHQAERMEFCGAVKELAGSTRTGESIYLNPCFVEEVMGYEIGWTDLEP
jgi:hypothetical protein